MSQTCDRQDSQTSIGGRLSKIHVIEVLDLLLHLFAPLDPTADAVTHEGHMPADGFPKHQVVERGDAVEILSRDLKKLCNIQKRLIRNPSTVSLDSQQSIDGRSPFLRVMFHRIFQLPAFDLSQHDVSRS